MLINRRDFLLLTAGLAAGCKANDTPAPKTALIVDAGAAASFAADGVYSAFRGRGFFIIRNGQELFALSAICTHRKCALTARADRSFYCKCHGSTFDPAGHVTKGPARRDLPRLPAHIDDNGRLVVGPFAM